MICVSISKATNRELLSYSKKFNFMEIRFDLLEKREIDKEIYKNSNIIATCRNGIYSQKEQLEIMKNAVLNGAKYVDFDFELFLSAKSYILSFLKESTNCKLIISYHNFKETFEFNNLKEIFFNIKQEHPDIIKIATFINSKKDLLSLFKLYEFKFPLIALGMGELGKISRLASLFLGAPFSYASINQNKTAPGQLDYKTLTHFLKQLQ